MKTFVIKSKPNSGTVRVKARSLASLNKRLADLKYILSVRQEKG